MGTVRRRRRRPRAQFVVVALQHQQVRGDPRSRRRWRCRCAAIAHGDGRHRARIRNARRAGGQEARLPRLASAESADVLVVAHAVRAVRPRASEVATDLTVLAAGGPVWSCGYDDHSIPPVRGCGNQGYQTGSIFATMAALTAVLHRGATGVGQFIDVSLHAAANVTTEAATYDYLVAQRTVQRQTGRHASVRMTTSSFAESADGRMVHSGVPPRSGAEYQRLLDWLSDEGVRDQYAEAFFLEMGVARGGVQLSETATDPEAQAIFNAGREGIRFMAEHMTAYEFFMGAQAHGIAATVVYSPEEVLSDPHFVARGFPVDVDHDELGASYTYAGLPFICNGSKSQLRRAPRIGEHNSLLG